MPSDHAPSFKRPPVIERLLGVEFVPPEKWTAPFFGLFWDRIRSEFPLIEIHSPIVTLSDQIDPGGTEFEFPQPGDVRCWFKTLSERNLIQVQKNRFLMNWRRPDQHGEYPRYSDELRKSFADHWTQFRSFLESEQIPMTPIVQCEVSYINHIPQGEGWDTAADWHDVFTVCNELGAEGFLPPPQSRGFNLHYPMPENTGSLRVKVARALRVKDRREVIQCELIARGNPQGDSAEQIIRWMDQAHDWVVTAFAELTTSAMHKRWERTS